MAIRNTGTSAVLSLYEANIQTAQEFIRKKKKIKGVLALCRLLTFLTGAGLFYYFWPSIGYAVISAVASLILLAVLVLRDAGKTDEIRNHERLIRINRHEADALQHQLGEYDDGRSFADPAHAYSSDLDLFGPASLFQFINRCEADRSKKLLADCLLQPLPVQTIADKQEAAKEVSGKTAWAQQFRSHAMAHPLSFQTEKRLQQWISDPDLPFNAPYWKGIVFAFSLISLAILAAFIADYLSLSDFTLFLVILLGIAYGISARITPAWALLSRIEPEMSALYEQLQALEQEPFHSAFMNAIKNKTRVAGDLSASAAIGRLGEILKRFDYRLNLVVSFFLNTFLLWDLRQLLALNDWKKKNRDYLPGWFSAMAETEVVISLASLVKNAPHWHFPEINDRYFNLRMQDMGHPLIPEEKCITNSFSMEGSGQIAIVTGSNMAGKSTFLRSLGTNLVLAYMGAPVYASSCEASQMFILSSMRVADNLAENTSTFYAELKKLQFIIENVHQKKQVFILLDEVLRGTNSGDRHAGTKALIRQLVRQQAVCVIATHDTELAKTEASDHPAAISNYHFDGQIRDGELFFDYRLRKGICESLNATLLMKKIGIHFEE
jgi:hypothetical protein